jgi:primary-amine oxidase
VRKELHGKNPNFRVITLQEPPKQEMISFLEGEHSGQNPKRPIRAARVQVTIRGNSKPNEMVELTIDLSTGSVIKKEHLKGKHPYIDSAYMQAAEKACRADPRIEAEIQKLKLPEGAQVVVEPWAYATDGMNDVSERTTMVRLYL